MRSQKTKKEEKLNVLLKEFEKGRLLSVSDISDILHCNRQSVYNYLNRLKEKGYLLKQQTRNSCSLYSLEENEKNHSDTIKYMPMTADILRKYSILEELQENPLPKQELRKRFTVFSKKEPMDFENKIPIDIKSTYFYRLINQLIHDGEITYREADNKYYLTGNSIPLIWKTDINHLYDMYDELSNITPGSPYYQQLRSVYQKAGLLTGTIDSDTPSFQNYLLYGRKHDTFPEIARYVKRLAPYDYKNRLLEIEYTSKKGNRHSVLFATGMIVYCLEKDAIYLLGKNMADKTPDAASPYTIINISSIHTIKDTEIGHSHYHSDYFQSVFDTMFSISAEKPVKVTVEFDRVANVQRKIEYLHTQRKFSRIYENEENHRLVYEDTISGLSDFANYLRQFGKSVHIIEPEALKEKMRFSVNRSLERYGEV